jgi:hypothetical protein
MAAVAKKVKDECFLFVKKGDPRDRRSDPTDTFSHSSHSGEVTGGRFLAIFPTSLFSTSDSAPAALETYRYFRLPVRIVGPESEKLRVRKILTRKQK